ncbi:hypothetical protein CLU79DRAFT_774825 [Phycomyces nitens]|nr:hypothetical protein CLU79DRAFT_774825 [Phycomyces nitens]
MLATSTPATTQIHAFDPPSNLPAIRRSIVLQLQKQRQDNSVRIQPPTKAKANERHHGDRPPHLVIPSHHLDNGLPSPPVDCQFETKTSPSLATSLPISPVATPPPIDTDNVQRRLEALRQEKHRLFQAMKDLLQPRLEVQVQEQKHKPTAAIPLESSLPTTPPSTPVVSTCAFSTSGRESPRERSRSRTGQSRGPRPASRYTPHVRAPSWTEDHHYQQRQHRLVRPSSVPLRHPHPHHYHYYPSIPSSSYMVNVHKKEEWGCLDTNMFSIES